MYTPERLCLLIITERNLVSVFSSSTIKILPKLLSVKAQEEKSHIYGPGQEKRV